MLRTPPRPTAPLKLNAFRSQTGRFRLLWREHPPTAAAARAHRGPSCRADSEAKADGPAGGVMYAAAALSLPRATPFAAAGCAWLRRSVVAALDGGASLVQLSSPDGGGHSIIRGKRPA